MHSTNVAVAMLCTGVEVTFSVFCLLVITIYGIIARLVWALFYSSLYFILAIVIRTNPIFERQTSIFIKKQEKQITKIKQIPKMNETNDCDSRCDHIEANQDRGRGEEM